MPIMFNLLSRPSGASSKSPETSVAQVFSEQDVRELFKTFNLGEADEVDHGSATSEKLIPSKSKDGLIQTHTLVDRIKRILEDGRNSLIHRHLHYLIAWQKHRE
jgi:hypothetical protein